MINQITVLLCIIFLSFYASIYWVYGGQRYSSFLANDVEIHREQYGIPHIFAKTREEAIYGAGFVHAQDRLWQLQMRRMISQGRMSEIFGESGLKLDQFIRNMGYLESAYRIVQKLSPIAKSILQSYANGINDGVASLYMLPPEFWITNSKFQEWTIYDSITFSKLITLSNVNDYMDEFMKSRFDEMYGREMNKRICGLGAENQFGSDVCQVLEKELNPLLQGRPNLSQNFNQNISQIEKSIPDYYSNFILPTLKGSNAWVIHGNHTITGQPYLANDPHLDNNMPSQWYQLEMNWGTNFAIGGTLPGIPFVLTGRSQHFSWAMTTLYADSADFYEEKLKFDGQWLYLFKDQWLPANVVEETIIIKDKQPLTYERISTHHGPIVEFYFNFDKSQRSNEGHYYSLQSIFSIDDVESIEGILNFQSGTDLKESIEYLKTITYPNNAMVVASRDHIGYIQTGRQVIRDGHPDDSVFVKCGWEGKNEWIRYVNISETQTLFDPPRGYIVVANNKIIPENKYGLGRNTQPSARGKRLDYLIRNQIKNGKKFTMDDMKKLQLDFVDSFVQEVLPTFIKLLEKFHSDHQWFDRRIIEILRKWDGLMDQNSKAAALWNYFEEKYRLQFHEHIENHFRDQWHDSKLFDSFIFKNFIDLYNSLEGDIIRYSLYCNHKEGDKKCITNIYIALQEAYNELQLQFGNNWSWGQIKTHYYPHTPFTNSPLKFFFDKEIPYQGNKRQIFNIFNYYLFLKQRTPSVSQHNHEYQGLTAANYRQLISMDPDDSSYYVIDTGISGNLLSQHYDDQQKLWSQGKYLEMRVGQQEYPINLRISPQ